MEHISHVCRVPSWGVGMEENKMPVFEWPQPASVKELQWFLGFSGELLPSVKCSVKVALKEWRHWLDDSTIWSTSNRLND